jgi:hypothetical protein
MNFGPRTVLLRALTALAILPSQKRRVQRLLHLERALIMRRVIGVYCLGHIERLTAEEPRLSELMQLEVELRWRPQWARVQGS